MKLTSKIPGLLTGLAALGLIALGHTPARANIAVSVDYNTVTRTLDPLFNGVNYVSFWDTRQGSDGGREALRRSGAKLLRYPGGVPASWSDWANPYLDDWSHTSPLDLWNYAKQIGMTPLYQDNATTNHGNDPSAAHAAAFITYCINNGINAPLIEVDNEPDNGMPSADDTAFLQWYFDAFNAQAPAMRAKNAGLKVMGPAGTNVYYWWSLDSLQMFLTACNSNADAISLHYYDGALSSAQDWVADWNFIRSKTSKPIYITEWNAQGGTGNSAKQVDCALANADTIGAFAKTGVQAHCFFGSIHGVQDNWGILAGDGDYRAAETPAPSYFILPLWSKMGDQVLNVTNPANPTTVLSAWSHKKSDGSVQVMLINKGVSQTVDLTFTGYNPTGKTVNVYECKASAGNAADYDVIYNNVTTPAVATTDLPGPLTQSAPGTTFTRTLPAYSITVLDFPNGAPATPAAPTGLTATPNGSEISLWWTASAGATSYTVKRSTVSGSGYVNVATTNSVGFLNTGLTDGTAYYFVVSATNSAGTSANSSQANATPVVQTPNFVGAKAGIGQVQVTWQAAHGATSYNVKRSNTTGGPYTTIANTASLSSTDSSVTNGTTYYYVVSGKDAIGESANSREYSATPATSIAINCGGPAVAPFIADTDVSGGSNGSNTATADTTGVTGPGPLAIYQTEHYGAMTYTVPLLGNNAPMKVRLHFTEDYFSGAGQRIMNVTLQGVAVLTNFDIYAATGAQHKLIIKEFNANADASGNMNIVFDASSKIDAIEVIPTTATIPATPTGLTATPWAASVNLSWSYVANATTYNVKRSTVSGSGYATVASPAGTTYTNTGLTNGTTYYYVVSAVNTAGESGNSAQASATPTATPSLSVNCGGAAAGAFIADAYFSGGNTASNTANTDTSGVTNPAPLAVYQSERYGTVTYTVPNMTVGQAYTVRMHFTEDYWSGAGQRIQNVTLNGTQVLTNFDIYATTGAQHKATIQQFSTNVNASGQIVILYQATASSPDQSAKMDGFELLPAGGGAPPIPTGLAATPGNAQVALTWNASSGATAYDVKRSTISGSGYATVSSPAVTNYTNTGLTNGTTYYFVVDAKNASGTSANSSQVSATPTAGIPPVPTGLTATAGNTQVALTWNASAGATAYDVKRSTVSGSGYVTVSSPTVTNYTNTGLTNGTTYYFVVDAKNASGTSANSSQVSATPTAGIPPVPTGLTATAGNTQVALTWNASAGATAYDVKRSTVSGSGYVTVSSPTVTNYTNTGLTNGTTYYFVVDAKNASGTSANSAQVSATPQPAIPPVPTGLTATPGNAQVALTWNASAGATAYDVKRSTVSGSGYVTVSSPTVTNYTNTGLTNGTTYYFVVDAKNAGGTSANSAQVSATPSAGGSGSLTFTSNGNIGPYNLTTEGPHDWIKWGATSSHKATGGSQISNRTALGTGTINGGGGPQLSWTDGTPVVSATNDTSADQENGTDAGFWFTAPADTTQRVLVVHLAGWNSGGKLVAHLSDGSAADFVDTTYSSTSTYNANYTLTYKAAAAGQTLKITWTWNSGNTGGNVNVAGAAF